ncbi:hypothetical protein VPH35_064894 [Triticum aestivum]
MISSPCPSLPPPVVLSCDWEANSGGGDGAYNDSAPATNPKAPNQIFHVLDSWFRASGTGMKVMVGAVRPEAMPWPPTIPPRLANCRPV